MSEQPSFSELTRPRALAIATVAQSLHFQAPGAWGLLEDRGLDLHFAAAPDKWAELLAKNGRFVPVRLSRNVRPRDLLGGAWDIRGLMRREWALIQVQSPIASAVARLYRSHPPLLYVAHGFHFHRDGGRLSNALFMAVEWSLASRCRAIAVVCQEDFDSAQSLGLDRQTLIWRLPGAGIDLDDFPGVAKNSNGGPHLLFMGELNQNKNPLHVVNVMLELQRRGHAATATIVGDGPLRHHVLNSVSQHPRSLSWLPYTSTPAAVIQSCDVVLAPSAREGLPRVVIESLATGRPVVARSNRGSRELLTLPVHGQLLSSYSDTSAWADAVLAAGDSSPANVRSRRDAVLGYGVGPFLDSYGKLVDRVLNSDGSRDVGAVDLAQQREDGLGVS